MSPGIPFVARAPLALVVEDAPEARGGWLGAIAAEALPSARILRAGTIAEARKAASDGPVALALVEMRLPDGSGIEVVRALRAAEGARAEPAGRAVCVLAAASGGDAELAAALSAGADGYVTRDAGHRILAEQVRLALDGVPALSPAVARRIMGHFAATGPTGLDAGLTRREREVLGLIGSGRRNAEAAGDLGISSETVSGHVKSIYAKLGISSRAEAAWHAASMGLAAPPRR